MLPRGISGAGKYLRENGNCVVWKLLRRSGRCLRPPLRSLNVQDSVLSSDYLVAGAVAVAVAVAGLVVALVAGASAATALTTRKAVPSSRLAMIFFIGISPMKL